MSTTSIERPSRPQDDVADGVLVRQHLHGRDGAFEVIYRRYNDRLVDWFDRRLNSRALAEDLAQDTMVRVLKYADSFDQDRPMWPWLKTTAYRVMINHLEATPEGDESLQNQYHDEGELDPLLSSVERRPELERVMNLLSERYQVALSLRYVRGWSPDDVADFFGMTRNACNQLVFRARKAARREYERVCGEIRALVWPFILPFAARWRSAVGRFRESRLTTNSPQLANLLPSVENAVQAVVATAVAMFVVAATVGVSQLSKPDGAAADPIAGSVRADLSWGSVQDGSGASVHNSTHDAESTVTNATAEVPEHDGGTRQVVAVSSGDASPAGNPGTDLEIAAETERSVNEDEDRDTFTSRIRARIGEEEDEEEDVVYFNLYCDTGQVTQSACDAVDELP